ncbi:hypothetical protein [Pseudomonas sp. JG-B]|uniref:hypothetical protein n=1 Tax=Pseudomonas sp. JG-B TaxID=2603214 RepID=UPI00129E021A|nr:hypothetical protein [Pseudomonas sp. JG-B]MRK19075.1 hypothetical protein [Pseudomonas sp. JG-B]
MSVSPCMIRATASMALDHDFKTRAQVINKAEELGASRFTGHSEEGNKVQFNKVDGEWVEAAKDTAKDLANAADAALQGARKAGQDKPKVETVEAQDAALQAAERRPNTVSALKVPEGTNQIESQGLFQSPAGPERTL